MNGNTVDYAVKLAGIAVLLNLLLPLILAPLASTKEMIPTYSSGVEHLSYKEQFMHMLVHQREVPVSSSLLIFALVFLSVMVCSRGKLL